MENFKITNQHLLIDVLQSWNGLTLEKLFREHWKAPKKLVHEWRMSKEVAMNGNYVTWSTILNEGDTISIPLLDHAENETVQAADLGITILYEDDVLLIANKPAGMETHPSQPGDAHSLLNGVAHHLQKTGQTCMIKHIHRLDKDTAGLLVVAKNDNAHVKLSKQLEDKTCKRIYVAIIDGRFKQPDGEITTYINRDKKDRTKMAVSDDGKLAITKYKTLEFFKDYSLVEFELKTGRTHQIRVHCKHLHHPIIGDSVYGGSNKFKLKGQCLFAKQLEFVHPITNQKMVFCAPLPDYFENVLNYLRKNNAEN